MKKRIQQNRKIIIVAIVIISFLILSLTMAKYIFKVEDVHTIESASFYFNSDIDGNYTKEWDGDRLFGSLYEAIRSFLLANAIRDIRDVNKNTHRSMLINMSRFTKVQSSIMNIVEEYFKEVKRSVKQTHKLPAGIALSNPIIQSLKQTFENEYTNLEVNTEKITWQKVFSQLYDSISKIKVVVVNSSKNSSKLNNS